MKLKNFSNTFFNILLASSLLFTTNNHNNNNIANASENISNSIISSSEIDNFNTPKIQNANNSRSDENIGFTVFSVLVGEIALRNGNISLSSDVWKNLALHSKNPLVLERATEIALGNDQSQRALNLVNKWLNIEPKNTKAIFIQISILFLSQKFDELLTILRQHLSVFANQTDEQKNIINFVTKLLKNNNFADIKTEQKINNLVIELSKDYENFAETQTLLATSFLILDDKEKAIEHFKKSVSLDGNNEQVIRLLTFYIRKDFPRETEKILSEFLQKNPNAIMVRSELFEILLSQKKLDQAYQQIQILSQQNKVPPNFIFALAIKAASGYNENAVAVKLLTQLLQEESVKNNTLLSNLYNLHLANSQIANNAENQAIDTLYKVKFVEDNAKEKFVNLYRNSSANFNNSSINIKEEQFINELLSNNSYLNARMLLAELLYKQNKISQAKATLQQTLINTNNYDKEKIVLTIAEAQIIAHDKTTLNNEQQAYLLLKNSLKNKANKNFINDTDFLYSLALFAGKNNNNTEMERLLKRLIKINPEHSAGLNALGYYYVDANIKNKFKLAEQYILKALEISNNKDAYIIDSLGWLYYRRGDFNKAYENLNFAYSNTKEVEIGIHLLQLLQTLKNKPSYKEYAEKYAQEFDKIYNELNQNSADDKIFIKYKNSLKNNKKLQKK